MGVIEKKIQALERGSNPNIVTYEWALFENLCNIDVRVKNNIYLDNTALIVEPHTVMEHIYGSIMGEEFLH